MKNNFSLIDFLPSKLMNNQLRSVCGGGYNTAVSDGNGSDDYVYDDGSTSFTGSSTCDCDANCE